MHYIDSEMTFFHIQKLLSQTQTFTHKTPYRLTCMDTHSCLRILKRIIEGHDLTFVEPSNALPLYSASQCFSFFYLSPPNSLCMPFIRTACITLLNGCPCQWFSFVKVKCSWKQNRYPILNVSFLINRLLRVLYCFVLTDRLID